MKISAKHPITRNTTECEVVTNNKQSYAKFGSFSLLLDEIYVPGKYTLTIPYDGFTIVKDNKEKEKGKTMTFKCVNESVLGLNTILYANLKEFPDYLSIKAGPEDTCFTKGKITFNINKLILEVIPVL